MTMTVVEAGCKGGLAVRDKRGREFYQTIGSLGQKAMREKYPGMAKVWGRMGGRPRKPTLAEIEGEVE